MPAPCTPPNVTAPLLTTRPTADPTPAGAQGLRDSLRANRVSWRAAWPGHPLLAIGRLRPWAHRHRRAHGRRNGTAPALTGTDPCLREASPEPTTDSTGDPFFTSEISPITELAISRVEAGLGIDRAPQVLLPSQSCQGDPQLKFGRAIDCRLLRLDIVVAGSLASSWATRHGRVAPEGQTGRMRWCTMRLSDECRERLKALVQGHVWPASARCGPPCHRRERFPDSSKPRLGRAFPKSGRPDLNRGPHRPE
jgi:hypothetical protein